jgi:hypothetical protein
MIYFQNKYWAIPNVLWAIIAKSHIENISTTTYMIALNLSHLGVIIKLECCLLLKVIQSRFYIPTFYKLSQWIAKKLVPRGAVWRISLRLLWYCCYCIILLLLLLLFSWGLCLATNLAKVQAAAEDYYLHTLLLIILQLKASRAHHTSPSLPAYGPQPIIAYSL